MTSPLPSAEFALRALASDDQQEASRDSRDALMRRLGFCPWIGPSQAPLGGDRAGLFLKGAALPGTVVALYPGQTFTIDMRMRVRQSAASAPPEVTHRLSVAAEPVWCEVAE